MPALHCKILQQQLAEYVLQTLIQYNRSALATSLQIVDKKKLSANRDHV